MAILANFTNHMNYGVNCSLNFDDNSSICMSPGFLAHPNITTKIQHGRSSTSVMSFDKNKDIPCDDQPEQQPPPLDQNIPTSTSITVQHHTEQSEHSETCASSTKPSFCKRLFVDDTTSDTQAERIEREHFLDEELKQTQREQSEKYNFDFISGCPLPVRECDTYQWEPVQQATQQQTVSTSTTIRQTSLMSLLPVRCKSRTIPTSTVTSTSIKNQMKRTLSSHSSSYKRPKLIASSIDEHGPCTQTGSTEHASTSSATSEEGYHKPYKSIDPTTKQHIEHDQDQIQASCSVFCQNETSSSSSSSSSDNDVEPCA